MSNSLLPNRYKNKDFFICDVFGSFKDDIASMEHPVFSLSKKPDHRVLSYEYNGIKINIKPSYTGLATILDKDILLYLASSLMGAKNSGEVISKIVRFTSYDYLVATNKGTGGFQYTQMQEGLERLKGTVIQTNIKTNKIEITEEFGLIDAWKTVKENGSGKAVAIEVRLSDWFYNSIVGDAVLTIDKDYFRLRKPTERRLYELARKHCGNQVVWKIKLDNLKAKIGITSPLKTLRFNINKITETDHLPEYSISMKNDVVMFTRKSPPKKTIAPNKLSKQVTENEIKQHARPGETTAEVKQRIIQAMKDAVK